MRKKIVFTILAIICFVIAGISFLWLCIHGYQYYFVADKEVIINEKFCEYLFDCDFESFPNADLDVCDEVEGFNSNSYVSQEGKLIIKLTENQSYKLVNSEWMNPEIYISQSPYSFDMADDYSSITLNIPTEIAVSKELAEPAVKDLMNIWWRMKMIKVNVHGDTNVNSIQIRVVNSDTGEIIMEGSFIPS